MSTTRCAVRSAAVWVQAREEGCEARAEEGRAEGKVPSRGCAARLCIVWEHGGGEVFSSFFSVCFLLHTSSITRILQGGSFPPTRPAVRLFF
jgi:hypothetical protein